MRLILCLGDAHHRYLHKPTFRKILDFIQAMPKKPTHIVQIGDLYDLPSFSKFAYNPNIMTPAQELKESRECAEEMWRLLKKYSPKSKCIQLIGNHDERPLKRLKENNPELLGFVEFSKLWKFKGVKTIQDPRSEFMIGDICFIHGYKTQLGAHARFLRKKCVVGHSHRGGVAYLPEFGNKDPIWELNCGYMADPEHEALRYTAQKFTGWIRGFGLIDEHGPRFIPL